MDYFIAYLSQFYEVVVFTSQHAYVGTISLTSYAISDGVLQSAMPVIEQLDPYGQFIIYRLCREYTRSIRGKIVKVRSFVVTVVARLADELS